MKFLLQLQQTDTGETESLGIFNTPEDAMRSFPRAKEWFEYKQPYNELTGFVSLLLARGVEMIYAFIEPVEESPEFVDTVAFEPKLN